VDMPSATQERVHACVGVVHHHRLHGQPGGEGACLEGHEGAPVWWWWPQGR